MLLSHDDYMEVPCSVNIDRETGEGHVFYALIMSLGKQSMMVKRDFV